MFALIEGCSFVQIASWVLHEVGFGLLAAKAVCLALDRRVDGTIRRYVFMIGKTPGTHVAELASRGISVVASPSMSATASAGVETLDV